MIKKAILTGGGRATRLRPITATINKHLIPLANKPMIFHAIEKVVEAGVEEIFINTNPGETELQKVVGDGSRWQVKIKFFEQSGGPQGIAHVVKQAQSFIGSDPFMFYLSDNIILGRLDEFVNEFVENNYDCMLALSKVDDARSFGVPYFDEQGHLIKVVEKPADPPSNLAVTGIYLYGPDVFFDAFNKIEKSQRGEYEISDIHSLFLIQGKKLGYKEITGWWKDTGKPIDLLKANALLMDQLPDSYFQKDRVFIDQDTVIGNNVKLIGPVIIGQSCQLSNCTIGPYVTIGKNCVIKNVKLDNSLLFSDINLDCQTKISQSIIGKEVKLTKQEADDKTHNLILGDKDIVEL